MRIPLVVLFAIFFSASSRSQSLTVMTPDISGFPNVQARFYAFDATAKQHSPAASEFTVSENGVPRMVLSVNCSPQPQRSAISSVLVIDVSGSMASGPGAVPNITLAQSAATAWVNGLPSGTSECAITSFDDHNYL